MRNIGIEVHWRMVIDPGRQAPESKFPAGEKEGRRSPIGVGGRAKRRRPREHQLIVGGRIYVYPKI